MPKHTGWRLPALIDGETILPVGVSSTWSQFHSVVDPALKPRIHIVKDGDSQTVCGLIADETARLTLRELHETDAPCRRCLTSIEHRTVDLIPEWDALVLKAVSVGKVLGPAHLFADWLAEAEAQGHIKRGRQPTLTERGVGALAYYRKLKGEPMGLRATGC